MEYTTKGKYMPGYTGHQTLREHEEMLNKLQLSKHIPGYAGYIPNVKSENKFSESYGKVTAQSINQTIPKGMDIPPYMRYTSTMRENFVNQRNVQIMSTAELLGVSARKDVYKKPIPVETVNKFWGIDNRKYANDDTVNVQALDQATKNFWSFVDSNSLDYIDNKPSDIGTSVNAFWAVNKKVQEVHPGNIYFFNFFLF
jgi:hypothetical protein